MAKITLNALLILLTTYAVSSTRTSLIHRLTSTCTSLFLYSSITTTSIPSMTYAVSGGGKEYALKDIHGQDFSSQSYVGQDFTQCDAAGTTFRKTQLKGTRFFRANLKETDFSGADLTGASLEDTLLTGSKFDDAVLIGAYFSSSIEDAASLIGADFSDAQMPVKTMKVLCARPDVGTGVNSKTGVSTAESLMCP